MTGRSAMRTVTISRADPATAAGIAAVRNAAADWLTGQHGHGFWSGHCSERGVAGDIRRGATVHIALLGETVVGTMTLHTRKPWAIDPKYFAPDRRPLYLTNMAVAPDHQRCGVGRALLREAARIAAEWPADAVRLDAFDAPAGAGAFYARCGFTEVGRAAYRGVPLIYYEMMI
jgi:ribosomal protein S18 acetylase RimI-like enzyme